jgi:hypothetical protein
LSSKKERVPAFPVIVHDDMLTDFQYLDFESNTVVRQHGHLVTYTPVEVM